MLRLPHLLLLPAALIFAFTQTGALAAEAAKPSKPLSGSQQSAAQIHVMAGEMAAGRQQLEEAAGHFLAALELINDVDLAQRATALALQAGNSALSLKSARKWLVLAPNEMDPREVIARLSIESGDVPAALEQCQAIVSGHAGGVGDGLQHSARLLAQTPAKSAADALAVMTDLTRQYEQHGAAHQGLAIVALRFGQLTIAESAARKAIKLAPEQKEAAVLLAGVLARQGKVDEAAEIFEPVAKADPSPAELRLGYARVLLDAGQRDAAKAQLNLALESQADFGDALYALGVMAANDSEREAAKAYFAKALKGERAMDAAYQLGLLAEQEKKLNDALGYYEKITRGNPAIEAVIRRAHILSQLDRVAEARSLLNNLGRQLPQLSRRLAVAEATLLSDREAFDDALTVLDSELQEEPGHADLLYTRSLVHEKRKRIDLAEADLRAMIQQDADDARAMNALGYMLTVHTTRYAEARELIERAHKLDPEDAAILDSLGWVKFKLGKSAEARVLLLQAMDKAPDPEIAAHLGEVLWALGEKDEARAVWDGALNRNPDHQVLNETVKRLTP